MFHIEHYRALYSPACWHTSMVVRGSNLYKHRPFFGAFRNTSVFWLVTLHEICLFSSPFRGNSRGKRRKGSRVLFPLPSPEKDNTPDLNRPTHHPSLKHNRTQLTLLSPARAGGGGLVVLCPYSHIFQQGKRILFCCLMAAPRYSFPN